MIVVRPKYLVRLFDAVSQLANVLLLNGDANESISGRAYRSEWPAQKWINKLVFWEPDHCYWAYLTDLERARELIKGTNQIKEQ
jgi:hypothetical protein